jgi:uncharacterized protein
MVPEIQKVLDGKDLSASLVVRAGSHAYGIATDESDDDYLGVFLAPLRKLASIYGIESDTYTGQKPDFTLHEIGKFAHLALKANPAILESLWNPNVEAIDGFGRELVAMRSSFLHQRSLEVYLEYAKSQMKKMVTGQGLHAKGGAYNGKYGAHLLRLLHAGIHLAKTGEVLVRVPPELAVLLLQVRNLELAMGEVLGLAVPLVTELAKLAEENAFPELPDFARINELVIRARLSRG